MVPDMMPERTGEMNHDPTVEERRKKKTLGVEMTRGNRPIHTKHGQH